MRIYEFSTQGKALGAIIVVVATDSVKARLLVEAAMGRLDLRGEAIMTSKATDLIGKSQILYEWDGDY